MDPLGSKAVSHRKESMLWGKISPLQRQLGNTLSAWMDYQLQGAGFFRSLGLKAIVEKEITGARSNHDVDVYVQGDHLGISFVWIIECKHWKTNVTKAQVMTLAGVVQDVGADRGFLLSEKGFQSGALRASGNSNVTLTSLADLAETVGDRHTVARVASLNLRISNLLNRLRDIKRGNDDYYLPVMEEIGKVFLLPMAIEDAIRGELPTPYTSFGPDQKFANSLEEMLAVADSIISEVEACPLMTNPPLVTPKG
ncbi:restriction endonuclease [Mesorhizobium sp.]|uniref:restriction endonuclease n=1 Tax=Mesorhizobium sp. TaxID=1871066 RepID=UPI000FEA69D3|nr:restriction endonuclease [Mesorhizobium sp.]RWO19072.1 MAG: restriction endonuclease [Mesorhizobium sp.]